MEEREEALKYGTITPSRESDKHKGSRPSWICLEEVLLAGKTYQLKTAQVEYYEVLFQRMEFHEEKIKYRDMT